MKTKLFFFLSVLVIFTAISGCSFAPIERPALVPVPEETVPVVVSGESTRFVISIGDFSPGPRATYSPKFLDPPLSTFEKITIEVVPAVPGPSYTVNSTDSGQNPGESWSAELLDVPYGEYTIYAKAYLNESDVSTAYAAYDEKPHTFSAETAHAVLTLSPVVSSGTGTLRYKLTDPDTVAGPVSAGLYSYTPEPFSTTLYQALTVSGAEIQINNIPAGYYLLMFGDRVPSIVHIYKGLETELAETNDIFNLSVSPSLDSSISITSNRMPGGAAGKVRDGVTVVLTMSGQYDPNSVTLNGGLDNGLLIGSVDTNNGNGTFTQSFVMPKRSVVLSADLRTIPGFEVEFNDPNKFEYLRFWSVSPSAILGPPGSAPRGTDITVRAHESFVPTPSGEMSVSVLYWYLDGNRQSASDMQQTFTIPSNTAANYVGAIVLVQGVPHAIDILINHSN